jgi:hypothetical protein
VTGRFTYLRAWRGFATLLVTLLLTGCGEAVEFPTPSPTPAITASPTVMAIATATSPGETATTQTTPSPLSLRATATRSASPPATAAPLPTAEAPTVIATTTSVGPGPAPVTTAVVAVPDATATVVIALPTQTPTAVPTPTLIPEPTATPVLCPGAIPWNEAINHVGEYATVIGPVVGATWAQEARGKPTFLNLGLPYPDPGRFTVLIWIDGRWNFDVAPEEAYLGLTICVTGTIELYEGSPEMIVDGPEWISVP